YGHGACVEQDDKGWDARKRAYCLKIQPATGSFARNLIYSTKPLGGQNTQFAEVLCTKRTAFSHENEIRLIVDDIGHKHGRGGLYKINITPEELFEEICLDPRLSSSDFLNLRAEIQGMGVTTNIIQSDLYKLDLPRLKM
ncbi:hypothetical protein AB0127_24600, partial [Klebsiella pneumoniae]